MKHAQAVTLGPASSYTSMSLLLLVTSNAWILSLAYTGSGTVSKLFGAVPMHHLAIRQMHTTDTLLSSSTKRQGRSFERTHHISQRNTKMHTGASFAIRRSAALCSSPSPFDENEIDTRLVSDMPLSERGIGVGIDLGTTNSAVAVLVDGVPTIVPLPGNGRTIASVVSLLSEEEEVLVGNDAVEREHENPSGTYRNVKRVIGTGGRTAAENSDVVPNFIPNGYDASVSTSSSSSSKGKGKNKWKKKKNQSKNEKDTLNKQLKDAEENPAKLSLPKNQELDNDDDNDDGSIMPEEVSAYILSELFTTAEEYADDKVTRAVIGVPAYFNDAQRDATLRACQLAGIPKARLLREPEAAALAYGLGKEQLAAASGDENAAEDELVLVFDLGGGTFDVSVLEVGGGIMEVVATSGDAFLGGSDFDKRIADFFMSKIADVTKQQERGLLKNPSVTNAILRSAEAVRIHLSNNKVAYLALPITEMGWLGMEKDADIILPRGTTGDANAAEDVVNSTHVVFGFSRKTMEEICDKEFIRLLRPVREVAIFAGALLPGDSKPSLVSAAMAMEDEMSYVSYESFYDDDDDDDVKEERKPSNEKTASNNNDDDGIDENTLLQIKTMDVKAMRKQQQRGRKKARNLATSERKFRNEKKKADNNASTPDVKVQDSIGGRPISQVVLVGGATRMPAVGRLLAALTGVVPQRTVNPDEAVALGAAVQVGILDGDDGLNGLQVLTPIQAAVMRALAVKRGINVED